MITLFIYALIETEKIKSNSCQAVHSITGLSGLSVRGGRKEKPVLTLGNSTKLMNGNALTESFSKLS